MASKANTTNWKKIKADYLKGGISQQKLADKYGISYNTLHRRVNVEGWAKEREDYEKIATQKLYEKMAAEQADLMVQMAALHDRAGLIAFGKLLKQLEDFPDSAASTKIVRQSVKIQEVDMGDGKEPMKIPLKTFVESDMSEITKNFSALSKIFGLDAASKLAAQRSQMQSEQQSGGADDVVRAANEQIIALADLINNPVENLSIDDFDNDEAGETE